MTPSMLISAPTGVSWSIIPFPKSTSDEQFAEQLNMCYRATGTVNGYCNQVLRATVDTEVLSGPDYRVTVEQHTGNGRVILSRWPVTQVLAAQTASNSTFPRQWTLIPAEYTDIEYPVLGTYNSSTPSSAGEGGQSVLIAPGYVNWWLGRRGYRVSVSYINGWPHTGTMIDNPAGSTTMVVDDVTGFAGAQASIYDGTQTEQVHVTSVTAVTELVLPNGGGTVPAGPGTLTLAAPLVFDHGPGVIVSSLPQDIIWAAMLAATAQALEAGITSVSVQNLPGSMTTGGHGVSDIKTEYEMLLEPYRRVI